MDPMQQLDAAIRMAPNPPANVGSLDVSWAKQQINEIAGEVLDNPEYEILTEEPHGEGVIRFYRSPYYQQIFWLWLVQDEPLGGGGFTIKNGTAIAQNTAVRVRGRGVYRKVLRMMFDFVDRVESDAEQSPEMSVLWRKLGAQDAGAFFVLTKASMAENPSSVDSIFADSEYTVQSNPQDYNQMAMVSPDGVVYPTGGLSHLDWCHDNYAEFGINFRPQDDSCFDAEQSIALDAFKNAGWIRVKPFSGIELGYLDRDNAKLVGRILRQMAREAKRTLYVDVSGDALDVLVTPHGRPDFSDLEEYVYEREALNPAADTNEWFIRYTTSDGTGLMNNRVLNRDLLNDDEDAELIELMDYGLQQPIDVPSEAVFAFTQSGVKRHQRFIQLLTKAAGFDVEEDWLDPNEYEIVWESTDGQVALIPLYEDENEDEAPNPARGVDSQELDRGVQVEMEHTADPEAAERIALDHLREDPRYYTKLAQCFPGEHVESNPKLKLYKHLYPGMKGIVRKDFSVRGWKYDPFDDDTYHATFVVPSTLATITLLSGDMAGIEVARGLDQEDFEKTVKAAVKAMSVDSDAVVEVRQASRWGTPFYERYTVPELKKYYGAGPDIFSGNPPPCACVHAPEDVSTYEGMTVEYTPGQKPVSGPIRSAEGFFYLAKDLGLLDDVRERLYVFCLNTKREVMGYRLVAAGSMAEAVIHPTIVFAPAVALHAHDVAIMHNHPTGRPQPSADDISLTSNLFKIGVSLGIGVLDSIIVGRQGYVSLREKRPDLFKPTNKPASAVKAGWENPGVYEMPEEKLYLPGEIVEAEENPQKGRDMARKDIVLREMLSDGGILVIQKVGRRHSVYIVPEHFLEEPEWLGDELTLAEARDIAADAIRDDVMEEMDA